MADPVFKRLALIGIGLIGSSVARIAMEKRELAAEVVANARTQATLDRVVELGIADRVELDPAKAVEGADCVMLCAPACISCRRTLWPAPSIPAPMPASPRCSRAAGAC